MKKREKIITFKNIMSFILGGVIFGGITVVVAGTIYASQVTYTKNGQSTVDGALDTLYTRANTWVNPNDMGIPTNYIFDGNNYPTSSSPTTPPSGKNIYLGLYSDGQYGVCIKRNGTQHCFRSNNWIAEIAHVQNVFSDISCVVDFDIYSPIGPNVSCYASDFECSVYSTGSVGCQTNSGSSGCNIYSNESSVYCN